jgi:hypothetical protein
MFRVGIVLCLLISLITFIQGQSIQDILNNQLRLSETKKYRQDFINSIDGVNYRYPLIEEINLRTETDRNNWSRQEYALRVMFNNFGLSKTFKKEAQILKEKISLESKKIEQDVLLDLYKDIISIFFYNQKDSLNAIQLTNDEAQIQYLISLVKSGTPVNAKDILRLESNIYENQNNKELIQSNIKELLQKWKINSPIPLIMEDSTLYSIIHNVNLNTLRTSKNIASNLDQSLDDIDYQLDRKEDHRILDYMQLRYSRRDNLLFRDEFSIGMGLRLPYSGRQDYKATKYKVKQLENTFKLNIDKATFEFEMINEIKEFDNIYKELIHTKKQQIQRFSLLNENHFENLNVIELFKKDLNLIYADKTLDLRQELWEKYLYILYKGELLDSETLIK